MGGGGRGLKPKSLSWEGMDIFWNNTNKATIKLDELKEYEYKETSYFQHISRYEEQYYFRLIRISQVVLR